MPTTGIEPVIFACRRWIQVQRISHYAKQASTCDWRSGRCFLKANGGSVSEIQLAKQPRSTSKSSSPYIIYFHLILQTHARL